MDTVVYYNVNLSQFYLTKKADFSGRTHKL